MDDEVSSFDAPDEPDRGEDDDKPVDEGNSKGVISKWNYSFLKLWSDVMAINVRRPYAWKTPSAFQP